MPFSLSTTLDLKAPARERAFLFLIALVSMALRIFLIRDNLPDSISTAFAETISNYDPGSGFPPFPGSPIYVAILRMFTFLGISDVLAISLPSIISCSIAVFPLFNIAKRIFGIREAWFATVLYSLHPGLLAYSLLPGSDAVLIFPLLLGIRLTLRTAFISKEEGDKTRFISHYAGSAMLAFSIGLSSRALPFLIVPLILAIKSAIRFKKVSAISETINGYLIGLAIWVIPFLLKFSISDLFLNTGQQLPVFTKFDLPFLERLRATIWGMFIYGQSPSSSNTLLIAVPLIVSTLLFINGSRKALFIKGKSHIALFGLMLFFSALFSSNPKHPGSYGLIFPIAVLIMSNGVPINSKFKYLFITITILLSTILYIDRTLIIKNEHTAIETLNQYVADSIYAEKSVILSGPSRKAIKRENQDLRVYQIESIKEAGTPRFTRMADNNKIYYLSDIPKSAFSNNDGFTLIRKFSPLPLFEGRQEQLSLYLGLYRSF